MKEFALYKGDDFLTIGTTREIARYLGVSYNTVKFYRRPAYRKRQKYENMFVFVEVGSNRESTVEEDE